MTHILTNKVPSLLAIAAIADMSLIDLVSRPRSQEHSVSTIFKGGDRLFCGVSSKQPRFSHGSTVSVRDLFYKVRLDTRFCSAVSWTLSNELLPCDSA